MPLQSGRSPDEEKAMNLCHWIGRTLGQRHRPRRLYSPAKLLLLLCNQRRLELGLPGLAGSDELDFLAHELAAIQARQHCHKHNLNNLLVAGCGYSASVIAECIACGYLTAEDTVAKWLCSTLHSRLLLGAYVHAGFGMSISSGGVKYWTAVLARPDDRCCLPAIMLFSGQLIKSDFADF